MYSCLGVPGQPPVRGQRYLRGTAHAPREIFKTVVSDGYNSRRIRRGTDVSLVPPIGMDTPEGIPDPVFGSAGARVTPYEGGLGDNSSSWGSLSRYVFTTNRD
jgi:hypothetical protein